MDTVEKRKIELDSLVVESATESLYWLSSSDFCGHGEGVLKYSVVELEKLVVSFTPLPLYLL
jgi:hypothetical protein